MTSSDPELSALRLPAEDVSMLLQLSAGLVDYRDQPPAAAKMALQQLCEMTGAALGIVGTIEDPQPCRLLPVQTHSARSGRSTRPPRSAALVDRPDPLLIEAIARFRSTAGRRAVTLSTAQLIDPATGSPLTAFRRAAGLGDGIYSILPVPAGQSVISLHQARTDRARWTDRETTLVHLVHPELSRILTRPAASNKTRAPTLSPRQRQTLKLLLSGLSEKQMAASLQVSVHTVHSYVKSIYRQHHVCSRGELMALWVGKTLP